MKKKTNKIIINDNLKLIIILIFAVSLAMLSCFFMIGEILNVLRLITIIVSFVFGIIYFYKNYDHILKRIKLNKKENYITLFISLILFFQINNLIMFKNKELNIGIFRFLVIPSIYLIITLLYIEIKKWLIKFFKGMDKFDKKVYMIASIVSFIILIIIYNQTNYFYLQYDKVYSIDSGFVYNNIFADLYYYDIRHPLMSIFTYPIYSVINFIFSSNLKPIILQYINIQMLLIIGIELKRITKNNYVCLFYLFSFPTLLFSVFFEKYILCTFLVVTYLYNIFVNKKDNAILLTFIFGLMPTNVVIGITEIFKKENFKQKVYRIIKIILISLLIVILFGRIHSLIYGLEEIKMHKSGFGTTELSLIQKIKSTTKMIEHSFIGLSSSVNDKILWWNDVYNSFSIIGLFVIFIILFSIKKILKEKNKAYLSFFAMFIFSICLFVVLEWAVHESPLFSICYSWAIIPLFIYGLDKILLKINVKKNNFKYIYNFILIIMIVINLFRLFSIDFYLLIG